MAPQATKKIEFNFFIQISTQGPFSEFLKEHVMDVAPDEEDDLSEVSSIVGDIQLSRSVEDGAHAPRTVKGLRQLQRSVSECGEAGRTRKSSLASTISFDEWKTTTSLVKKDVEKQQSSANDIVKVLVPCETLYLCQTNVFPSLKRQKPIKT